MMTALRMKRTLVMEGGESGEFENPGGGSQAAAIRV
jgi:hypothetical protein